MLMCASHAHAESYDYEIFGRNMYLDYLEISATKRVDVVDGMFRYFHPLISGCRTYVAAGFRDVATGVSMPISSTWSAKAEFVYSHSRATEPHQISAQIVYKF